MEPYDAYQDDDGPTLRESVVLFLDLLGTTDPRTDQEAQQSLKDVHEALERARDWGGSDRADTSCVVSWFSDNLGMALPVDADAADEALGTIVTNAAAHQAALTLSGFPARGAIALGLFYADEELLYGAALNRAVALEKSRAIYPRVVLDEAAARAAREHLIEIYGGGLTAPHRAQLAVDSDGVTFVNYLGSALDFDDEQAPLNARFLGQHREFIIERLTRFDGEPHIHDKFRWLAGYHDWYLQTVAAELAPVLDPHTLQVLCSRPLGVRFSAFGDDVKPLEDDGPGRDR
jgi:hypothetical protein